MRFVPAFVTNDVGENGYSIVSLQHQHCTLVAFSVCKGCWALTTGAVVSAYLNGSLASLGLLTANENAIRGHQVFDSSSLCTANLITDCEVRIAKWVIGKWEHNNRVLMKQAYQQGIRGLRESGMRRLGPCSCVGEPALNFRHCGPLLIPEQGR